MGGAFPRQVGLADKASTLASRLSGEITRDYPRLPEITLATLGRGGQKRELCLSCEQRLFTAHTL